MLLNDGLETIGKECFEECGLEQVSIPGSVRLISGYAFSGSYLRQVCFLGTAGNGSHCEPKQHAGCPSSDTEDSHLESEQHLVIGEAAFSDCKDLKQIVFEPGAAVAEIQCKAFRCSGLESFTAPPSLRKIDALAFQDCYNLKTFWLNEDIQEVGWLCLLRTGTETLSLPPHIRMTREQLGLD